LEAHVGQVQRLFVKRLERGRFLWPQAPAGAVTISAAQLGRARWSALPACSVQLAVRGALDSVQRIPSARRLFVNRGTMKAVRFSGAYEA
jgi:hypothetical protein